MGKKLTFDDVINSKWKPEYPYDGNGPGVRVVLKENIDPDPDEEESEGVLFTLDTMWDEYQPVSHNMESKDDVVKLYSVLRHSNQMYTLLKSMDDERAKQLIEMIDNAKEFPQGY